MNPLPSPDRPQLNEKWMKETEKGVVISLQSNSNTRMTTVLFVGFGLFATGIVVVGAMMNPLVILALLPIILLLLYFRRIVTARVLINFKDRTIESLTGGKIRSQHAFDAFDGYSTTPGSVRLITQQWTPQNDWSRGMPQTRVGSGGSLYLHFQDGSQITVARSFDQAELIQLGKTIVALVEWADAGRH